MQCGDQSSVTSPCTGTFSTASEYNYHITTTTQGYTISYIPLNFFFKLQSVERQKNMVFVILLSIFLLTPTPIWAYPRSLPLTPAHSCSLPPTLAHSRPLPPTPACADAWISTGEWRRPKILLNNTLLTFGSHVVFFSHVPNLGNAGRLAVWGKSQITW